MLQPKYKICEVLNEQLQELSEESVYTFQDKMWGRKVIRRGGGGGGGGGSGGGGSGGGGGGGDGNGGSVGGVFDMTKLVV